MTSNGALEMYLRNDSCICNGGACTTECATASCATPPGMVGASSCPMCIDNLLMSNSCPKAISDCESDVGCKAIADCVAGCK
jgi:hypothetical protein